MDDSIIFSLFSCEHLYTPFNCYCIYCKKLTHTKNTCLKCGKYRLIDDYEIIKEFEWNEYSKRSFHIETDHENKHICPNCIRTRTHPKYKFKK